MLIICRDINFSYIIPSASYGIDLKAVFGSATYRYIVVHDLCVLYSSASGGSGVCVRGVGRGIENQRLYRPKTKIYHRVVKNKPKYL